MSLHRLILLCSVMLFSMMNAAYAGDQLSLKDDGFVEHEQQRSHVWYLRADVGFDLGLDGTVSDSIIEQGLADPFINTSFDEGWSIGGGFGLHILSRMRLDFTFDYRMNADVYSELPPPASLPLGAFTGELDTFVGMANLYYDFDFGHRITPYVGVGLGFAHHTLKGDDTDDDDAEFAWSLMAGAAIDLKDHWKLDVGYRYLDMGDIDLADRKGSGKQFLVKDIDSHEIRVGLRYTFGCTYGCEPSYEPMK